jgi:hypothetical protein
MNEIDLSIYETGNGGDVELSGDDFAMVGGFTNMPYLGWFGGNPGFLTTGVELSSEQKFDWWGNSLLLGNDVNLQFNSSLEDALNNNPLSSESRILLENIAARDLEFFGNFAETSVDVSIISDSRILIEGKIKEPGNLEDKSFQYIWDSTKQELIKEKTL